MRVVGEEADGLSMIDALSPAVVFLFALRFTRLRVFLEVVSALWVPT